MGYLGRRLHSLVSRTTYKELGRFRYDIDGVRLSISDFHMTNDHALWGDIQIIDLLNLRKIYSAKDEIIGDYSDKLPSPDAVSFSYIMNQTHHNINSFRSPIYDHIQKKLRRSRNPPEIDEDYPRVEIEPSTIRRFNLF